MWVVVYKLMRNKICHKLMQPLAQTDAEKNPVATNWRSDTACKKNLY